MPPKTLIRGGAAIAATAAALAFPSAAFATTTVGINDDHLDKPATEAEQGCEDGYLGEVDESLDYWVFVLPKATGDQFVSVTVTYDKGDGIQETLAIPGDGWIVEGSGDNKAVLPTEAGWTIASAEAEIEGDGKKDFFNLTHTCAATEESGENPEGPDNPDESENPDETAPAEEEGSTEEVADEGEETLPTTGASRTAVIGGAAALAAAGAGTLFFLRRRNASAEH
ncbi:LPXTG cell wall anchor domain-containing protein [Salininema proteolyticum]|uniref:LPXTG cell wall anchor domain-containing protein n=1 Tax=Salininema proteolyticum TaxID=1607685 RepID=A0ABV8U0U2_9ACTN